MISRYAVFAFVFFLFLLLVPSILVAQSYQGTSHLLVAGGVSVPLGGLEDFWNSGPEGRVTVRFPVADYISLGLQAGIAGPQPDDDNSELIQVPLRVLFYFPIAPEASGTPYIAVGPGATVNMFSAKDEDLPSFCDETKTYIGYTVLLGYTLRPEAMANAFFDVNVGYEQQFINDENDYKNVHVEAGIGLCF